MFNSHLELIRSNTKFLILPASPVVSHLCRRQVPPSSCLDQELAVNSGSSLSLIPISEMLGSPDDFAKCVWDLATTRHLHRWDWVRATVILSGIINQSP